MGHGTGARMLAASRFGVGLGLQWLTVGWILTARLEQLFAW